ncbi:MAG: RNA polymerase sigma factor [Armatimonadetes bacterium]|nr:RNA polymerase sigma factor [Armatimonadota bacterium]
MAEIGPATIEALRKGEEQAYAAVVHELLAPVYRFLLRLSGDSGTAEDLAQETFLAVWHGIGSFQQRSRFKTWIFGIAYRQFLRHRDKRTVETVPLEEWHGLPDSSDKSDPSDLVLRTAEKEGIRQAVYSLPDQYRAVVCLVHFEGLTYREVAEISDLPIGTVKSRMNSAFKLLREKLGGNGVEGYEMREPESLPGQPTQLL